MSQYEPMYDSFSHAGRGGYVPTPRMSVSSSVYLPGSDVDLQTGWLKPDRQRRCRTQGKRLEIERLRQEEAALQASIQREMSKGGVSSPCLSSLAGVSGMQRFKIQAHAQTANNHAGWLCAVQARSCSP